MANSFRDRSAQPQSIATQVADVLNGMFGVHPGFRILHAKGIVCEGMFRPAATAASVSRAVHLKAESVPVTVRFSNFPGIPNLPDNHPIASPRGLAIKFHLPGGTATDIVTHSYNGFPVSTPPEFLGFARAMAASGPGAPTPTPLESFAARRPLVQQFLAPKPTPASFATEAYFGVNALRFTNQEETSQYGRYRVVPVGDIAYLSPQDAAGQPERFLFDELAQRLSRGPAQFNVRVQLAGDGDLINDGSLVWPTDRPQVDLGTLSVTALVADSAAAERELIFDPVRVVDGIELSPDPMLPFRSEIYGVSYARRHPEQRREEAA